MNETFVFLALEEILELHREVLDRWGGADGIRDQGLLESAIAMPSARMYGEYLHEDCFHMAAAYAFHIAENQPFLDGNKRTGVAAALTFLEMNGIAYGPNVQADLYSAMFALADKTTDKTGLAELLRELAV
ncbi:MAG TPA: type II toxin-antitoxin system death-on-curing family toxin [Polyangiaceae bacterium]|nr:type II toxin-antitoxin system death-on-curing family toxin [Polyangiaceae bacterium]